MSNDVQAAAERLRRLYNANDSYAEVYGVEQTGAGLQQRDEQAVVAAYLALHDPTPLDEAWLKAVGAKDDDHPAKVHFERDDALPIGLWHVLDGWKAMLIHAPHAATCIVRGLTTRGQFRQLAAALGIDLREPGGER
jgi:hypothetical protein